MSMQKNKIYYAVAGTFILLFIIMGIYFFGGFTFVKKTLHLGPQGTVVQENLVIPNTQKVNGVEGRFMVNGNVQTPLMPKNESQQIVVEKAILTLKGCYNLAALEAQKWSADAKPVFIKSLGAVTLEGKSSQWQIIFSSASKPKKGYEIIVQADQIVSKKEIDSTAVGADFPNNLKDSVEAIKVLQELPQYSDATLSAISLYYNADGKIWRYTLSTSKGLTSAAAQ